MFTKYRTDRRLFRWDASLLIVALLCWYGSLRWPWLAANDWLVYGAIGFGGVVSLVSFRKRRADLA
uniref:Uncharacterized protein n=1 Tax=Candidatus Kentrum sp. FM TaxID=2126340 RepID=A0A450SPS5_9GAMM|nr:MAG: hypothetical protein BECKFM1743C_GA0114222_101654 [Candidatus Kentron sp. FM]VFJ56263.1 MAG: hypothetical protein BECKFM1743A_GA0114220_101654 [Candidatus Kentron sp. FM]VFK10752.1 MAG: hypothetical protein BECKFM1743B_GA0114221_101534 [Candidatus Kentron sp. FM]